MIEDRTGHNRTTDRELARGRQTGNACMDIPIQDTQGNSVGTSRSRCPTVTRRRGRQSISLNTLYGPWGRLRYHEHKTHKVTKSHTVVVVTMLLGQGHALVCGEPNTPAKLRPAPPGDGLGESQWTEICGLVGHDSTRNGVRTSPVVAAPVGAAPPRASTALTTHARLTGLLCRRPKHCTRAVITAPKSSWVTGSPTRTAGLFGCMFACFLFSSSPAHWRN